MSLGITYGSEYSASSNTASWMASVVLDDTHFVLAYRDVTNSNYGRAVVGLVTDGTGVSWGPVTTFYSGTASGISLVRLDSTHFVVLYRGESNSNLFMANVGTVNSVSLTFGGAHSFGVYAYYTAAVCPTSSSFVAITGYSSYGAAFYCTVSGTTITHYTGHTFNSYGTYPLSACTLDPSRFAVAYQDVGNGNKGTAVIGYVGGTTVTNGTPVVFASIVTTYAPWVVMPSTDTVVVGYSDGGYFDYGKALVGTVVDTSVSFGSTTTYSSADTLSAGATVLDATHVVVSAGVASNSGVAFVGTVAGGQVSFNAGDAFNAAVTYYTSVGLLATNTVVVAYVDGTYPDVRIGMVSGFGKKVNSVTMVMWNGVSVSKWNGI